MMLIIHYYILHILLYIKYLYFVLFSQGKHTPFLCKLLFVFLFCYLQSNPFLTVNLLFDKYLLNIEY